MTTSVQSSCWISEIQQRAIRSVLSLAVILLVCTMVMAKSGQSPTFAERVLYNFTGAVDGAYPLGDLLRDARGNLYGTTQSGGGSGCAGGGCGTVFKVTKTGKETVLYKFTGGTDGSTPLAGVVQDIAGNLYGTTYWGGDLTCGYQNGCGTVFKLDTAGKETVLYAFTGGTDGRTPTASLVRDAAGNLYGTTYYGGSSGYGVVFQLDTSGSETVLHSFAGAPDGANPYAGLVRDKLGNLYGSTSYGGDIDNCGTNGAGCGIVFKLDSTGKETVLHKFTGADGAVPTGGVILDAKANLYGTTYAGGTSGLGTVFKLNKTGKETVLYTFLGGTDGAYPEAGLQRDAAGNLYGTTAYGDAFKAGTAFRLTKSGEETVLHRFSGGADGGYPQSGLLRDAAGNLYGVTPSGGSAGYGLVFKLTPQ